MLYILPAVSLYELSLPKSHNPKFLLGHVTKLCALTLSTCIADVAFDPYHWQAILLNILLMAEHFFLSGFFFPYLNLCLTNVSLLSIYKPSFDI